MGAREFYWVMVKGEPGNQLAEAVTDEGVTRYLLPGRVIPRTTGQVEVIGRVPTPGTPLSPGDEAAVLERAIERMGWPEIRAFEEALDRG